MEDTNFQEQLQIAPPNAPTAQDADAQKAAQQAQISSALSTNTDPNRPAQSGFETPAAVVPPAPGSFGDKLNRSLLDAFSHPAAKVPGNAGLTLLSAVASAHSTPQSDAWTAAQSNADASQPTKAPLTAPKKGLFSNVFNALRDAQAMNTNPNAIPDRKRQEMTDQITMAHANSQMLHDQILVHKLGEDAILASVETGKQGYNAIKNANQPGTDIAKDVDSDEIKRMIDTKQFNPSEDTAFLTGRKITGKDANGIPMYRSTYSVIKPHGPVDLTDKDEELDKIKKYTGRDLRSEDGKKVTEVPAGVFNQLYQQVATAETNERAAQVTHAKDQKTIDEAQNSDSAKKMLPSTTLTKATAANTVVSKDGTPDPFKVVKTYDYLMSPAGTNDRAQIMKETGASNFSDAYIKYAGGENYFKGVTEDYHKARSKNKDTRDEMIKDYSENPNKIGGHTPDVIAATDSIINDPAASTQQKADAQRLKAQALSTQALEKQLEGEKELTKDEMKQKAAQRAETAANPNGLTGEAFIKTLPVGRAATLRAFDQGLLTTPINALARTDKGQAILNDLYTAYPDLDTSKAMAYAKMRKDFTSGGKEATGINASNTVLHHLNRMNENLNTATAGYTGSVEQFFGNNEAGRRVADDATAVSSELGRLYTGGVVTEEGKNDWETKLNPKGFGMTVNKLKTNVKEFAELLGGKLEAYQAQWDDGVPSEFISAPKSLASIDSQADYKKLTGSDMKVRATQQTRPAGAPIAPANAPAGAINISKQYPTATGVVQGSDGKWYAHDIKNTILGITSAPAGAQ